MNYLTLSLECLVDFSFSLSEEAVDGRGLGEVRRGGGDACRGGGEYERRDREEGEVARTGEEGPEFVGKGVLLVFDAEALLVVEG